MAPGGQDPERVLQNQSSSTIGVSFTNGVPTSYGFANDRGPMTTNVCFWGPANAAGRVGRPGCPSRPLTDLGVRDSRTRLFGSRIRCSWARDAWPRERIPLEQLLHACPIHPRALGGEVCIGRHFKPAIAATRTSVRGVATGSRGSRLRRVHRRPGSGLRCSVASRVLRERRALGDEPIAYAGLRLPGCEKSR